MFSSSRKERVVIEIGTGKTKVVVGRNMGQKRKNGRMNDVIRIRNAFSVDTPKIEDKTVEEGFVMETGKQFQPMFDDRKLQNLLTDEFRNRGIKADKVIVTVTHGSVISREMVIPKSDDEKLRSMIRYEFEEFLPIDADRYIIDYKIIEEMKEGNINKYKLLVAALPREEGTFYHNFVNNLGKDPFALDVTSNVISKLFDRNMKVNGKVREIEEKTFAYVDIGRSSIELNIIEKGILKFTRVVEGGMKAISGENDQDKPENEKMEEQLQRWVNSLEQMFKFYTSRETNREIDQIFLFGGGTEIPSIDRYMNEVIDIPVEIIKEIENVQLHKKCESCSLAEYVNAVASLIRR